MTTILGLRNKELTQGSHNDLQRHPSTSGEKSTAFGLGHLSVNDGRKPFSANPRTRKQISSTPSALLTLNCLDLLRWLYHANSGQIELVLEAAQRQALQEDGFLAVSD